MLAPTKENGIYKEGYLTKSPFHSDNNPVYGTKVWYLWMISRWTSTLFSGRQSSTDKRANSS